MNSEKKPLVVGQFSDSFPPIVDGVSGAVENYARLSQAAHGNSFVVTNTQPGVDDGERPYPVLRIPSLGVSRSFDYRIGLPFGLRAPRRIADLKPDLLHVHSPFAQAILARRIRRRTGAPIVMTYHTRFSFDVKKYLKADWLCKIACRLIAIQFELADEVWAVSRGAADDLAALGYSGPCLVMENGCDLPDGLVTPQRLAEARAMLGADGVPTLLYVGRMMWYKNVKLILDALARLSAEALPFRMVFAGDGYDAAEIRAYAEQAGLTDDAVRFVGKVSDRALLRALYASADLFVFPSAFDTSGLVVQEAASCACPSLLLRGSCAAERVTDGVNGFLCEESPEAVAEAVRRALSDPAQLARVGRAAQKTVYQSWAQVLQTAWQRYRAVCLLYGGRADAPGHRRRKRRLSHS
ncbi:MAG: glycosyltransferase [Oscillospiraceae bacterium]|jgi:glycosyltransferase involved in cell wall biosynthesis|nr:glycosyltransferase [Oscillospiraceae bacterium]